MALYSTTAFFSVRDKGWTETWYRDETQLTRLAAIADFDLQKLWMKRLAMLGVEATLKAIRTSFNSEKQDAWLVYHNFPGPGPWHCDYPAVAVQWRFWAVNDTRWKLVFVRGGDDNVSMNGGRFDSTTAAGFVGAGNAWEAAVKANGYGWMGIAAKIDKVGEGYGISATDPHKIAVGTEALAFPADQINSYQRVIFKKVNAPAKSRLNGRHVVKVIAQNNIVVQTPMALFDHDGFPFIVERFTPAFYAAVDSLVQKIVERKVGKPLLEPRGRALVKAQG